MALLDVGKLWRFARSIEDLMRRDKAHEDAMRKIVQRLDAIEVEGRLTRLEAQQGGVAARGIVVAEAKGAAAATGAAAAAQATTDLARRLGALEERSGRAAPDAPKRPTLRRPADPDPQGTA